MVIDEVGLVESGLTTLAIRIVDVVLAANALGTHPLNRNFILDRTVMVQLAITVEPDLKEVRAALAEFWNSVGKVTTI